MIDLPNALPDEVDSREELGRVLGVPMLLTDPAGRVALNADVPEIAALAEYAPCPIIYISTAEQNLIASSELLLEKMASFNKTVDDINARFLKGQQLG